MLGTLAPHPQSEYKQPMTQLLERAFAEVSKLPESEQDAVASVSLTDLGLERRRAQAFASSQTELSQLADEALNEFDAGETRPMEQHAH